MFSKWKYNLAFLQNISSDEGYYLGGKFQFEIEVPEAYNMVVSACDISWSNEVMPHLFTRSATMILLVHS